MSAQEVPVNYGKDERETDGLGGVLFNIYGMRGEGEVSVAADGRVTLRGRKPRPFISAKYVDASIDPARIRNVLLRDTTVRFEVEGGHPWFKSWPGYIGFKASSPESAAAIAAALPGTVTDAFRRQVLDQAEFEQQLERVAPRSYVTPALVAINILVFVAMALATGGDSILEPDGRAHIEWGSNFGPLTSGGQWWRLFTSTFLHFGLFHVALNMYALYEGGKLTERLYGQVEFLALYVVSGLAGSLASTLWNPLANSAGASGAIFGVYGAMVTYALKPGNRLPALTARSVWPSGLLFISYSLYNGFTHAGIDNAAHIGGMLGGIAMGLLLGRPVDASRDGGTAWRRIGAGLAAAAVVLPLLASQVRNTSAVYRTEQQYMDDLTYLQAEEGRLAKAYDEWRARVHTGGLFPAEAARLLDRDVGREWEALHDRMAGHRLDRESRLTPHQAIVLEYLRKRADSFRLLADAWRTQDRAKATAAAAMGAQADKATERLRQLNGGKK